MKIKKFLPCIFLLFLMSLLVLGFLLVLNCSHNSQRLVEQKYSEGFSLRQPEDWQARVMDKTYIWISSQEVKNTPFLVVYPFFLEEKTQSSSWLREKLPTLSKFFSGVKWGIMKQIHVLQAESPDRRIVIPCTTSVLSVSHIKNNHYESV